MINKIYLGLIFLVLFSPFSCISLVKVERMTLDQIWAETCQITGQKGQRPRVLAYTPEQIKKAQPYIRAMLTTHKGFYCQETGTVHVRLEGLSAGVVAHEYAHRDCPEFLCQFVDKIISGR